MKTLLLTIASVLALASTSYAKEVNMVCMTDDTTDMDLRIVTQDNGDEALSVILTGMDGETVRTYSNDLYKNSELSNALNAGYQIAEPVFKVQPGHEDTAPAIATIVKDLTTGKYNTKIDVDASTSYSGVCTPN